MANEQLNYENAQKAIFDGAGEYDIPQISAVHVKDIAIGKWIGFNYAKRYPNPNEVGVHFFLDDYQFNRVWNRPDTYTEMLRKFGAVMTPDFSMYTDYPKALQIYSHYKKHWIGAYWQSNGMCVIPSICWSDIDSFAWCFDGEPVGGVVAVSTVGTQSSTAAKRLFALGYDEMMLRLKPEMVIMFGERVSSGCGGNIKLIQPFQAKFKDMR